MENGLQSEETNSAEVDSGLGDRGADEAGHSYLLGGCLRYLMGLYHAGILVSLL